MPAVDDLMQHILVLLMLGERVEHGSADLARAAHQVIAVPGRLHGVQLRLVRPVISQPLGLPLPGPVRPEVRHLVSLGLVASDPELSQLQVTEHLLLRR